MKSYLHSYNEPDLFRLLVASAVLHLLFIGFMSLPSATKEREHTSYFVDIVTPMEIEKKTGRTAPEKPPVRTVKSTPARPDKAPRNNKLQLKRAAPEKSAIKKINNPDDSPPPLLSRQPEQSIIPIRDRPEIMRRDQSPDNDYLMEPAEMHRNYRTSAGPAHKGRSPLQAIDVPGEKPENADLLSLSRGNREAGFGAGKGLKEETVLIARLNRQEHSANMPADRGTREDLPAMQEGGPVQRGVIPGIKEDLFPLHEEGPAQAGIIAREITPVRQGPYSDVSAPIDYERTAADLANSATESASAQTGKPAIIEKPGVLDSRGGQGTEYPMVNEAAVNYPGVKGGQEYSDKNNRVYPEISIKGIPLNDLMICPNALEERTLKTRILETIGNKRHCYIPDTGRYVFLGTGRFTSFDMIIVPEAGRELLNRCEELKNALDCLHSLKE